ncbi:MAG: hypothetical protein WCC17_18670 [Candidatus Nitrosopolaris sp.]
MTNLRNIEVEPSSSKEFMCRLVFNLVILMSMKTPLTTQTSPKPRHVYRIFYDTMECKRPDFKVPNLAVFIAISKSIKKSWNSSKPIRKLRM